jgi:hypothetical protein
MSEYADGVGQGKASPEPVDAYDNAHGKYEDKLSEMPTEKRLPLAEFPKAPDPKPYKG